MKKNLSYTELDRYTEIKNGFGEDKSDCCFGGGVPWGNKDARKAARASRLAGRAQRRRR